MIKWITFLFEECILEMELIKENIGLFDIPYRPIIIKK